MYHDGHEQETDFLNLLDEKTQVIRLVLLFLDMFIGDLVIVRSPPLLRMITYRHSRATFFP